MCPIAALMDIFRGAGAIGVMAPRLSEQVDHSHWCRHNSIGHNITFYYSLYLHLYHFLFSVKEKC